MGRVSPVGSLLTFASNMKLDGIIFPAKELKTLPEHVAVFTVTSLDFANELSFLVKALFASMPQEIPKEDWKHSLLTSQALFYTEIAAGKLYEYWRCIETQYWGLKISQLYHDQIDKSSTTALDKLKSYFSDPNNAIKQIRRSYAFHSDPDKVAQLIRDLPDDTDCRMTVSPNYTNVFFEFASGICHRGVYGFSPGNAESKTMHLIQNVVIPTLMNALTFAHGFSVIVLKDFQYDTVELGEVSFTKIEDMELPFFVER